MDRRQTIWEKWVRDPRGKLVIGQRPNGPQLIGLAALLVFWLTTGRIEHVAGMISYGAWFTWAWLEITSGVNYFRKSGGIVIMIILVLIALFR